jgi:hypothetical protein
LQRLLGSKLSGERPAQPSCPHAPALPRQRAPPAQHCAALRAPDPRVQPRPLCLPLIAAPAPCPSHPSPPLPPPLNPPPPQTHTHTQAFKNYDEAGNPRRVQCLKYLVLASMLSDSSVDPFDAQEAKPYKQVRARARAGGWGCWWWGPGAGGRPVSLPVVPHQGLPTRGLTRGGLLMGQCPHNLPSGPSISVPLPPLPPVRRTPRSRP